MGLFGCDYLETEGGIFTEYRCKYSRQTLDSRTVQDICMTSRYTDCSDYQNASRCFITTAVCLSLGKPDNCEELTVMRLFRDEWLRNQPDGESLIADYYNIAPNIVKRIDQKADRKDIYKSIYENYILPCVNHAKVKDYAESKTFYVNMVNSLKDKYC